MPPHDVVVTGHVCVDLVPAFGMERQPGAGRILEVGPLRIQVGGCVANTGLALAALGSPVRLDADIGDDALAELISTSLVDHPRVSVDVRRGRAESTSYSIIVEVAGNDRAIWHHPGANARFDGEATNVRGTRLVHLGYPPLLPQLAQSSGARARALFDRSRRAGATTSLDFATPDAEGASGEVDWLSFLRHVLPATDVFCPSVTDLQLALHRDVGATQDIKRLGADLLTMGVAVAALKAGRRGMYLRTGSRDRLLAGGASLSPIAAQWADKELWFSAPAAPALATTGAGDAAAAGLLFGLVSGFSPEDAGRAAMLTAGRRISGHTGTSWKELTDNPSHAEVLPFTEPGWTELATGVYAVDPRHEG